MKNWKTTLGGLLVGLTMLFGGRLTGDTTGAPITGANVLQAAAVIVLGLVSKDKDVTGGARTQDTAPNPPTLPKVD